MEAFWNNMTPILVSALGVILTTLASWLGVKIKEAYEKHVNTELKEKIVKNVVLFIEQTVKDLHGKEKLDMAIQQAAEWLNNLGIKVTEAELTILIESACKALNLQLYNEAIIAELSKKQLEAKPKKKTLKG